MYIGLRGLVNQKAVFVKPRWIEPGDDFGDVAEPSPLLAGAAAIPIDDVTYVRGLGIAAGSTHSTWRASNSSVWVITWMQANASSMIYGCYGACSSEISESRYKNPARRGYAERQAISQVLQLTGGNRTEAARRLRTDYKTLYVKMKQYSIPATPFRNCRRSPL